MTRRMLGIIGVVSWLVLLPIAALSAQGVTGAAVRGTVTDDAGQPVSGAIVSLVNGSNG